MAYIYEKNIHGRPYYYLRISKRVDDKIVVKDIAYLGNDILKIKIKLNKLPQKHKNEIRKGYKSIKRFLDSNYYLEKIKQQKLKTTPYMDKKLLNQIEAAKLHFNDSFLKHNNKTIEETYKNFLIEFAFNTTSIEGNTITLQEADKLLRENLTPKEKTPRDIFDLQNTEKVFFYLLNETPRITSRLMIDIHDMLMKNIDLRKGLRTHNIRVFKSRFKASPAAYVKTDVNILFAWYNDTKKKLHPLVLAAMFHHKFERIHPFSDGNGRAGRIIMNHMLMLSGYPPIIVKKKNRSKYLSALSKADKADLTSIDKKHFKPLIEYLAQELVDSYWNSFNI